MSEQDLPASPVRLAASSLTIPVNLGARILETVLVIKMMPERVIWWHGCRRCRRGGQQPGAEQRHLAAEY